MSLADWTHFFWFRYEFGCQADLGAQLTGTAQEMEKQLGDEKMKLAEQEEKLKMLTEQVKMDKAGYSLKLVCFFLQLV